MGFTLANSCNEQQEGGMDEMNNLEKNRAKHTVTCVKFINFVLETDDAQCRNIQIIKNIS